MTQAIGRGGTITLDTTFVEGTNGPAIVADPVLVDIIDPDDIEVVSNATPTSNPSTGFYTYDYGVAVGAKLGIWYIRWSGVVNDVPVVGPQPDGEPFEVVEAGTVLPDGDSFATLADFEGRKGDVETAQETVVANLLIDATALIRAEAAGSTAEWVTGSGTPPALLKPICVEVAYRAWSNPDALSQSSIADSSISYRGGASDALFLTDNEKKAIRSAAGTSSVGSVTLVSPYSGDDEISVLDFWPDL